MSSQENKPHQNLDTTVMSNAGTSGGGYLSAGAVIDDTYTVLSFLGAGAAGQVYRVRHNVMHKEFALKILMGTEVTENAQARFQTEIKVISKLSHPNVVQVHNSGIHAGKMPYYVMDLINGETLGDFIKNSGALPLVETLDLFICVADALQAAHNKTIIHRDIKPGNIVLSKATAPIQDRVKVVDFGIAKLSGRDKALGQGLTSKGEIFGSPLYMSPEQCVGGRIDARSDIYSLGCTLFEALTGSPPFVGRNMIETFTMHQEAPVPTLVSRQPSKKYPQALEELIEQMLEKLPDDRYQSMGQVASRLDEIREEISPRQSQMAQAQTSRIRRPAKEQTQEEQKPLTAVIILSTVLVLATAFTGIVLVTHDKMPWVQKKAVKPKPLVNDNFLAHQDIDDLNGQGDRLTERVTKAARGSSTGEKEKTAGEKDTVDTEQKDDPSYLDKITPGSFYKGQVTEFGELFNEYVFPNKKVSGGYISYDDRIETAAAPARKAEPGSDFAIFVDGLTVNNKRVQRAFSLCKGTIKTAPGSPFTYTPLFDSIAHPRYMLGFRKGDVTGLDLSGIKSHTKEIVDTACGYFDEIKVITLTTATADDAIIDAINKSNSLTSISLVNSQVTAGGVLKLKRLENLSAIYLSDMGARSSEVIARLSKSKKLRKVSFTDMPVHKADLENLAKIPNLEFLELDNTGTTTEDLMALKKHRYFYTLNVRACPVDPIATAEFFATIPGIREIQLGNKTWDKKTLDKLHLTLKKMRYRGSINTEFEVHTSTTASKFFK